jgi:hypothetical protein
MKIINNTTNAKIEFETEQEVENFKLFMRKVNRSMDRSQYPDVTELIEPIIQMFGQPKKEG